MSTETRLRQYFIDKVTTLNVAGQPMPAAPAPIRRTRLSVIGVATAAVLVLVGLPLVVLSLLSNEPGVEEDPTPVATTVTATTAPTIDAPAMVRFASLVGDEERSSTDGVMYAYVPAPTPENLPAGIEEQPLRAPAPLDQSTIDLRNLGGFGPDERRTPFLIAATHPETGAFTILWVASDADGQRQPHFCTQVAYADVATGTCRLLDDADTAEGGSLHIAAITATEMMAGRPEPVSPIHIGSSYLPLDTAYTILTGPYGDKWMQRPVSGTVLFFVDTWRIGGTYELAAYDHTGNQLTSGQHEVSTQAEPIAATEAACGTALPFATVLPADFIGPVNGSSPDTPAPTEEGQLVVHWTGRGGSVELRWPPNATYTDTAVWGEATRAGNTDTTFLTSWNPIMGGVEQPAEVGAFAGLPSDLMLGPCDAVQLDVFRSSPDLAELSERVGATFGYPPQPPGDDGLLTVTVYPSLPRARDFELIVESIEIGVDTGVIAPVVACEGGAAGRPPNNTQTIDIGPIFDHPRQALQALLATSDAETWPKTGYFEFLEPDGSITYGNPLDDLSANPPFHAGLVVSISVVQTDSGWTVDSWETSGC